MYDKTCKWHSSCGMEYREYDECPEYEKNNEVSSDEIEEAIKDIPFDRLKEMCNAEREGRCVVLPCKVKDELYLVNNGGVQECRFHGLQVYCDSTGKYTLIYLKVLPFECGTGYTGIITRLLDTVGKTVFLTREEAEKALEALKK